MKALLFLLLAVIPSLVIATNNVYASPEYDYDEKYEDVPGAPECWYDGYKDGQNNDFNQSRNDECGSDKGDQYYRAFIYGCIDANNTRETCELFTD